MAGAARGDVKYGFFVGIGVLIAVAIWGLISGLTHGAVGAVAGG